MIEELSWRGLVHQATDAEGLGRLLTSERTTAYIGFDPTADSLHVGSLQMIILLRHLERAGHRPIALVGGGTGMIGDPSFKSDERTLLDAETLSANRAGIRAQLERFIDFGPEAAVLEDNASWLGEARLLAFLRDVGKHFSVNEMIRKDSVRSRLEGRESFLSFTEFSYMLLQAWDFVELHDRFGCRLQMGGSDQWGNIIEGVDLIRRLRGERAFGLTSPLLTKADGSKFGKTETGNVWLDARRTSPYAFYQFWLRSADADVVSYLRRLTFLDRAAVEELGREVETNPGAREAQRALAREVTTMVHGPAETSRAELAARVLFTDEIGALDAATLASVLSDAPSTELGVGDLDGSLTLTEALVRAGLSASKGAARRDLAGGGVYVNGKREAQDRPLGRDDALHGRFVILRRGKANQHVLVRP
jgi:tyrosyl-tRNA synthetase